VYVYADEKRKSNIERRRRTSLSNEGFDRLTQRTEEDKLYSPTKIHISIKLTATREKGNNEKSIKVTRKVDWVCVIRLIASKTVINIDSNDKSFSYLLFMLMRVFSRVFFFEKIDRGVSI
jgi:hypothetical protein